MRAVHCSDLTAFDVRRREGRKTGANVLPTCVYRVRLYQTCAHEYFTCVGAHARNSRVILCNMKAIRAARLLRDRDRAFLGCGRAARVRTCSKIGGLLCVRFSHITCDARCVAQTVYRRLSHMARFSASDGRAAQISRAVAF